MLYWSFQRRQRLWNEARPGVSFGGMRNLLWHVECTSTESTDRNRLKPTLVIKGLPTLKLQLGFRWHLGPQKMAAVCLLTRPRPTNVGKGLNHFASCRSGKDVHFCGPRRAHLGTALWVPEELRLEKLVKHCASPAMEIVRIPSVFMQQPSKPCHQKSCVESTLS